MAHRFVSPRGLQGARWVGLVVLALGAGRAAAQIDAEPAQGIRDATPRLHALSRD